MIAHALAFASDLINKYPRIFYEFDSDLIFKVVLGIVFLGGSGRPVGSEAITNRLNLLPHCRSIVGISRF